MAEFPSVSGARDEKLAARWEKLFPVRDEVLKSLEEARAAKLIGSSLEAKVILAATGETLDLLRTYADDLRFIFIVSQVELTEGEALSIKVEKAEGEKCERCWNYSLLVGANVRYPAACERCAEALTEIEAGN